MSQLFFLAANSRTLLLRHLEASLRLMQIENGIANARRRHLIIVIVVPRRHILEMVVRAIAHPTGPRQCDDGPHRRHPDCMVAEGVTMTMIATIAVMMAIATGEEDVRGAGVEVGAIAGVIVAATPRGVEAVLEVGVRPGGTEGGTAHRLCHLVEEVLLHPAGGAVLAIAPTAGAEVEPGAGAGTGTAEEGGDEGLNEAANRSSETMKWGRMGTERGPCTNTVWCF